MHQDTFDLEARFVVEDFDEDEFDVLSFEGEEAISRPFWFRVGLASESGHLDLDSLIGKRASLAIAYGSTSRTIHGVIDVAERHDPVLGERFRYDVVLVPRVAALERSVGYQIHLDRTVPDILRAELSAAARQGLKAIPQLRLAEKDVSIALRSTYPAYEYRCQFADSDLAFLSRLMEYEGMFYYFRHDDGFDKLCIGDDNIFFQGRVCDLACEYQRGALEPFLERIYSFRARARRVNETMVVNDYNYRSPEQDLLASAQVDPDGIGAVHALGDHHLTPEDGARIATVRAQAAAVEKHTFEGNGHHFCFEPGRQFSLQNHFCSNCNATYRIVAVRHHGRFRAAGGGEGATTAETKTPFTYHNDFTCIPAALPYRPPRRTPRPMVPPVLSAWIDAEGEGHEAELDPQGRYRVRLPFDLSGRPAGKASAWVRLATPLAGAGEGMQFPLRKGAEVLLSHVLGDPDRPVIVGALTNPGAASTVTAHNPYSQVIATASGMRIALQDNPSVTRPITHVPPPPSLTSTILASASDGSDDGADEGSADGSSEQGDAAPVPRPLGAAAADPNQVPTERPRHLSAASDTETTSSDHVTDSDKSYQVYVPDYKSSSADTLSSYLRLGGTPPQTDSNYEVEKKSLNEILGLSDKEIETTLKNNDLGWYDFTDGGRASFTEGFQIDRVHDNGKLVTLDYTSAKNEQEINYEVALTSFDMSATMARTLDLFFGSRLSMDLAAVSEVSIGSRMEIGASSTVALKAGFEGSVAYSASYERTYGPETLAVFDADYDKVARTITLTASQTTQAADAAQRMANYGLAITTAAASFAGLLTAAGDVIELGDSPSSEQMLTKGERTFLDIGMDTATTFDSANLAANIATLGSYVATRSALKAEQALHLAPELKLSASARSGTLTVGDNYLSVDTGSVYASSGGVPGSYQKISPDEIYMKTAAGSVEMRAGMSYIKITSEKITISAPAVEIRSTDSTTIQGTEINVGSALSAKVQLSGTEIKANDVNMLA